MKPLNAKKNHEREAHIVAPRPVASTRGDDRRNMASRGTDILLGGGNP